MKIIKSDETECDELKEIENKMKSEYYKTKKIICKEMEDFFFMSVLKCDRTFTQLTIDDKMIIFRNKIDTIFYPYLDKVIFDNRMKLFKIINDDYNCRFNEYEINNFERDVCEFKTAISNLIYKILKALRKTHMYDYTKSYVGKYKRLENYNLIMVMINDLIDNFNRFSIKYKNSIWSLTPYTLLLENIKIDLNLVIKNIKSSLNKMQRKTAIILDEPIKRKLFNIIKQILDKKLKSNGVGLCLGSELSQLTASLYLSKMDHILKECYRIKWYGRYNDDICIIHKSKEFLINLLKYIKLGLSTIGLKINETKTKIINLKNNSFIILKTKYFYDKYKNCGKVIMLSGRKSSKIERRKLRKFKIKMTNKTMNFLEIFNLYKAWRKNILKQFNAYNLISRNDEYFKHLFNLKYANFKNKTFLFK